MSKNANGRGCEGCENPDRATVRVRLLTAGDPQMVGTWVQWCDDCAGLGAMAWAHEAPVLSEPVNCEPCEVGGVSEPLPAVMLAPDAEGLDSPACEECGPAMVSAYADRRVSEAR